MSERQAVEVLAQRTINELVLLSSNWCQCPSNKNGMMPCT